MNGLFAQRGQAIFIIGRCLCLARGDVTIRCPNPKDISEIASADFRLCASPIAAPQANSKQRKWIPVSALRWDKIQGRNLTSRNPRHATWAHWHVYQAEFKAHNSNCWVF